MDIIKKEYKPTDKFILRFTKLKYNDFCDHFDLNKSHKDSRNQYDNRLRPSNLLTYFMFEELENSGPSKPHTKEASTQTDHSATVSGSMLAYPDPNNYFQNVMMEITEVI